MGVRGIREADPTPEEIAERAAEIRRNWNKKDVRLKAENAEPYRVPVFSPDVLSLARPIVKLSGY